MLDPIIYVNNDDYRCISDCFTASLTGSSEQLVFSEGISLWHICTPVCEIGGSTREVCYRLGCAPGGFSARAVPLC